MRPILRKAPPLSLLLLALGLCQSAGCSKEEDPPKVSYLRISLIAGSVPVGGARIDVTNVNDPSSTSTYCFVTHPTDSADPPEKGKRVVSFVLSRSEKSTLSGPVNITLTTYQFLGGNIGFTNCPDEIDEIPPFSTPRTITTEFCNDEAGAREFQFHLAPECSCEGAGGAGGSAGSAGAGQAGSATAGAGQAGAAAGGAGAGGAGAGSGGSGAGAGGNAAGKAGAAGVGGGAADMIPPSWCCADGQICGMGFHPSALGECPPNECCNPSGDACTQKTTTQIDADSK